MQKWIEFKARKSQAIDKYIKAKRQYLKAKQMYTYIVLKRSFGLLNVKFIKRQERRDIEQHGKILAVHLYNHWKKVVQRNGKTFNRVQINKVRKTLSFIGQLNYETTCKKAMKIIKPFFIALLQIQKLTEKGRIFYKYISLIQQRIRLQLTTRYFKVEVLQNYWDKLLGEIHLKASQLKDKQMLKVCGAIIMVNSEIRNSILKEFIKFCSKLHIFAYFQWRLHFPSKVDYMHNRSQIDDILRTRQKVNERKHSKKFVQNKDNRLGDEWFANYGILGE